MASSMLNPVVALFTKKNLYISLCVTFIITIFITISAIQSTATSNGTKKDTLLRYSTNYPPGIQHASVYLYEFKTKEETAVNDNYQYMPASLIKVPAMIAYYKLSEQQPDVLKKILSDQEYSTVLSQNIIPEKEIQTKKAYTIDDLISYMILYSDNRATELLFENINSNIFNHVFTDQGIPIPDLSNISYTISIKDYAKFFKILYEESYLNKTMSQKAIDLLEHSEYTDGLVAGVPHNIPVAHKFGERTINGGENGTQFHECGIVYYPTAPYLLCVMTAGNNMQQQTRFVKSVSKFVYTMIDSQNLHLF